MRVFFLSAAFAALATAQAPDQDLEALLRKGKNFFVQNEFEMAIKLWDTGLNAAREQQDSLFLGSFHGNLGAAYGSTGEFAKAVAHFEESLSIASAENDRQGLKNRLNNLGALYLLHGRDDEAADVFEQAVELARALDDWRVESKALNNLGEVRLRAGEPLESIKLFRQSLAIADEREDRSLQVNVLTNIGLAFGVAGHVSQGLSNFRRALSILALGVHHWRKNSALKARVYDLMGLLVRDAGDPAAAVAMHQNAVELAVQHGDAAAAAASREHLAHAMAVLEGGSRDLASLRVQGLRRMQSRLRAHGLDDLAVELERNIAELRRQQGLDASEAP